MRTVPALFLFLLAATVACAQRLPDQVYMKNIRNAKLYGFGDPQVYPVIALNGNDQLELHFDDMDAGVKQYYYTLELRNADWSPVQMSYFDYVRGFTMERITTYRQSTSPISRYTHYQALLPDRNIVPTKSGNYVLKVFLNGDTSKLAFTRRILVADNRMSMSVEVRQPVSQQFFRTHHRLVVQVSTRGWDIRYPQQQIRLNILQNYRWDNALTNIQPTYIRPETLEFVNEQEMLFPAMREWRWTNLRSFRLLGDRIARQENTDTSFSLFVTEEKPRIVSPYYYFNDMNGRYINETTERINPLWEADYAMVHFSFATPDGMPYRNSDLVIFGEISNYGKDPAARMVYNSETKRYEAELFLKQGYYDYVYALYDPRSGQYNTDFTEGNTWETENSYMVLLYYRELGGRYDQLLGIRLVNSMLSKTQ